MAIRKFLLSCCGLTLTPPDPVDYLAIEDTDRVLLTGRHYTISVNFDATPYAVDMLFEPTSDILSYLNTTFVATYGLTGIFTIAGGEIRYSNEENFTTAEIMAIFIPTTKVYVVGTVPSDQLPNVPYETVANGNVIVDPDITGLLTAARRVNGNLEPLNINGYTQSVDFHTVTFNGPELSIENSVVYLSFTETT